MDTKKLIRKKYLALRDSAPEEERRIQSDKVARLLFAHPAYLACRTLFTFVSMRSEIDTLQVICRALTDGKTVAVPKVIEKEMKFYRISSPDELSPGAFGVMEPEEGEEMIPDPDDLMLVPGAAFDRRGYRIGYGGGFYDRYFASHPAGFYTIAPAFDFQLTDEIPADLYDLPVREVLTVQDKPEAYISGYNP